MKGLQEALKTLNHINVTAVPVATAQAVNRVAQRAISRSTKRVAGEVGIRQKLVRQRVRLRKASPQKRVPQALIQVNRGNLPAIRLGTARTQLYRRKTRGQDAGSVLKIGRFTFRNAFIQQLANGRWHVMRREGKKRYPIEVVKIPLVTPLTVAYQEETKTLLQTDMSKELQYAINNQIRLKLTR